LNTGIYLECWISLGHADTSAYMFTDNGHQINGPKAAGHIYRQKLKLVFQDDEFAALSQHREGLLGVHSIRKFATTYAKATGHRLEDVETRARWKHASGRMIGRYIAVDQPGVDANCCEDLCVGGAIAYKIHPDASSVTNEWLVEKMCPKTHAFFNGGACSVAPILAKAVLWACMDPVVRQTIPAWLVVRVRGEYELIATLEEGVNPIVRVPICVWRSENVYGIHEFGSDAVAANTVTTAGDVAADTAMANEGRQILAAQHGGGALTGVAHFSRIQQGFVEQVLASHR